MVVVWWADDPGAGDGWLMVVSNNIQLPLPRLLTTAS